MMCLCQFGQNPPIGSEDRAQTRADADEIRTKSNMYPFPFCWGDITAWTTSWENLFIPYDVQHTKRALYKGFRNYLWNK